MTHITYLNKSKPRVQPVIIVIPIREVPRIRLEFTPFPNIIGFESNLNTIR